MKKLIIASFLTIINTCDVLSQTQNLIQNGNFETFNSTTCCSISTTSCTYDPISELNAVSNPFNAGCLASTGWYSSHGSADLAIHETILQGPDLGERTIYGYNAQMLGTSNQGEGIYFDNNLSLLPNTVYTLTVFLWTTSGNAQTAHIKLANGLTSSIGTTIPSVQNQTIYTNNFSNTYPQKIVIDFVPNDTYHQVWFYLTNTGSFNIDEIDLRVKEPYSGIDITSATCCADPVIFSNTILPSNILGKESITGNNTTSSSTTNTVLQAGVFIRFTPGSRLTSGSTNSSTASIVECKPKPFSDGLFSAGPNVTVTNCDIGTKEIGSTRIQKGVTYSWISTPSTAIQSLGNLVGSKTYVLRPIPDNISITFTLSATNSCGTRQSSMVYTHVGSCCSTCRETDAEDVNNELNAFTVYPNPSNGSFVISSDFSEEAVTSCTIFNNSGKEIYSKSFGSIQALNRNLELNLPNGIYLVKIKHADTIYQKKILITQ